MCIFQKCPCPAHRMMPRSQFHEGVTRPPQANKENERIGKVTIIELYPL